MPSPQEMNRPWPWPQASAAAMLARMKHGSGAWQIACRDAGRDGLPGLGQVFGGEAHELQRLSMDRVGKSELPGMQGLTLKPEFHGAAVQAVTHQGMTDVRQVNTNLVGAARVQAAVSCGGCSQETPGEEAWVPTVRTHTHRKNEPEG